MTDLKVDISAAVWDDARVLWDYHLLHQEVRPCSVIIGLGSHDLGVATTAARLYTAGMAPRVLFTGANSPTTQERFPRGEAIHYREHAIELGVPAASILVEPKATNTGQNIILAREVLEAASIAVSSVLIVSKPYEERRSFATCKKLWPAIEVICTSERISLDDYVENIGNAKIVIDMLVGTLQRLIEYPAQGFTISQEVPPEALNAYQRLASRGFDSRLIKKASGPIRH
ncbi:YdcF family protein [Kitasatospora cineracea]|uniref:YdcF family protein n=1 Tax=Kitasatospora cineracea TaxID=88074 RepID=UPI003441F87B